MSPTSSSRRPTRRRRRCRSSRRKRSAKPVSSGGSGPASPRSFRVAGRFITLEGGEGVGKSTQLGRLAEALRARGIEVVTTREPGGSPGAEAIRKLLLEGEEERWTPEAEALLFAA